MVDFAGDTIVVHFVVEDDSGAGALFPTAEAEEGNGHLL